MKSEIESGSAQTVIGGSYYSTTAVSPKIHLFPSAVERVFNLLDALTAPDHIYAKGEKHPSPDTIQYAKDVLLRVLPSYFLRTADIDAFQGEIHVSWEREMKRIVLFVPAKNVLKLYLERVKEDGAVRHIVRSIDDPREVINALRWLFS